MRVGEVWHRRSTKKKCRDVGLEGLEVAPDMEHNVDLEVINGAGGRISG